MEEVRGERLEILNNAQLSLEIIAMACTAQIAGVNATAFGMVFEDLHVSLFATLKRLGLIPQTSLPTIVWQRWYMTSWGLRKLWTTTVEYFSQPRLLFDSFISTFHF